HRDPHALRLPRLGRRHAVPRGARLDAGGAGRRRRRGERARRPHHLETSREPAADLQGDRAAHGIGQVRFAVLGGGSWGTVLAAHVARAGHPLRLWLREERLAADINERRENPLYLPGVTLPAGLEATTDLALAVAGAEAVLVVIPSEFCRAIYRRIA